MLYLRRVIAIFVPLTPTNQPTLETVLDRDVVTTGHQQEVFYSLSSSSNCYDLGCTWRSFVDCFTVARFLLASMLRFPSALAELVFPSDAVLA